MKMLSTAQSVRARTGRSDMLPLRWNQSFAPAPVADISGGLRLLTLGNFQIRKIGTMEDLYKEVDIVLGNAKDIETKVLACGLKNMFAPNKHLDVCFIRQASELFGIHIDKKRMLIYGQLHCIDWSAMEEDVRSTVMSLILDDFRTILNPA